MIWLWAERGDMAVDLVRKYDQVASKFTELSYADPGPYFRRRLKLTLNWGAKLAPGDSVLELGCGDGYLAVALAKAGLKYSGLDFSPEMVQQTEDRLVAAGPMEPWSVQVADINNLQLSEGHDAIVAFMRDFFSFCTNPVSTLKVLRGAVKKKLIIDCNPRKYPVDEAVRQMRAAGFVNVKWRPFMVPSTRKVPEFVLSGLELAELIPGIRALPLRYKFSCLILGHVPEA